MKTSFSQFLATIVVALALGLGGTGLANAQACLDNRQIQEAMASGQIMSLKQVLAANGIDPDVEIPNPVQVCDEGGRLVYIIGVLTPSGDLQNVRLSAQ